MHPSAWKVNSRKSRLGKGPPEQPGVVQDQAVLIHRQVRAKPAVETHEPVGPAPVARLQAGVALRLRPGLELSPLEVGDRDLGGFPGRQAESAYGQRVRER